MTELINKEELLRRFADFGREIPKDQVFEVITSLQEEIVRCGSCIHGQKILKAKEEVACDIWGGIWTENGFCSNGERKDDAEHN